MKRDRANRNKTSWNPFLRDCLRLHRNSFIAVVIFSFVINLLMLTVPLYLLQIFNRVVPSKSPDTLLFLTGIVVVAVITLSLLESTRRYIFVRVGSWLDSRLGGLVMSGSIARSVDQNRITSARGLKDLATIRSLFASSAMFPIIDAPWTPIFLFVLFTLHPLIGLISLLGAVALFLVALSNQLIAKDVINEANDAGTKAEEYASSILRNSDAIEAMGMRPAVIAAWEKHHSVAVDLKTRASMRGNRLASIAKFIRMMLQVIVIGTAGLLVLRNQLSAGGLIASVLLMGRAVAPMDRAIDSWKLVVKARKAFDNVSKRLDQAPELNSFKTLQMPHGYLSVRDLKFQYPKASKPTLRAVTFKAKPGECIGLAGNTAAGKSTLARLLVGLTRPDSGYVRLGGVDLTHYSATDLGPFVGYLPQDVELFSGSIRENIARMDEGHFDKVVRAAQITGVHEIIQRFPDAYDTEIGEQGAYLSGGQRQRIALARAIYGDPRIVILDEPDANLDSDGRAGLVQTIAEMKRADAIVIVISHHKILLKIADKLLVLRDGEIVDPTRGEKLKSVAQAPKRSSGSQVLILDPAKKGE
jgi:ATP-binding cassette subfamily B protein/ATP-binding cassette subfamily C protein